MTQRYSIPTIRPVHGRTGDPPGPREPGNPAPVHVADPRAPEHRAATVPAPPQLPRATAELERGLNPRGSASVAPARIRARGTPSESPVTDDKLRTLIFAREASRASWIEGELQRAPVTIQVARRVRTVVAALTKDPPPRPDVLIVDFDAITPPELFELHAVRHEGWTGRLIALGNVPEELRVSLGIRDVFTAPLVRDSLLDCLAGTRHAVVTLACPILPPR